MSALWRELSNFDFIDRILPPETAVTTNVAAWWALYAVVFSWSIKGWCSLLYHLMTSLVINHTIIGVIPFIEVDQ